MDVCSCDNGDRGIGSKDQWEIATMNDVGDEDDNDDLENIGVRLCYDCSPFYGVRSEYKTIYPCFISKSFLSKSLPNLYHVKANYILQRSRLVRHGLGIKHSQLISC